MAVYNSINKTDNVPAKLSFLTYNMHGFNQGHVFLEELCKTNAYDVIFIQEHWLPPAVIK
jgi:hypothetical protein